MRKWSIILIFIFSSSYLSKKASCQSNDLSKEIPASIGVSGLDNISVDKSSEQAEDWARYARSSGSSQAWMHFYRFKRLEFIKAKGKELGKPEQSELTGIYQEAKVFLGSGHEAKWMLYLENYMQNEGFVFLEEAYAQSNTDHAILPDVAGMYLVKSNNSALKKVLKELKASGYFDQALLVYAKNTLKCLPANAILISSGASDTWPLLIEQQINGTRPDVRIVFVDGLLHQPYRQKISSDLLKNSSSLNDLSLKECVWKIGGQCKKYPVLQALTLPESFQLNQQQNLEILGLSLLWKASATGHEIPSPTQMWNGLLDKNFTQFNHSINKNYLPLLFALREQFYKSGNTNNARQVEEGIRSIASQMPNQQVILQMLK